MGKIVTFLILIVFSHGILAQDKIHPLDEKGGFQDIMLDSLISQYPGLKEKKKIDEELFPETILYVNNKGVYETIGRVKVYSVEVKTYKDRIYEIIVTTEYDPAIYQGLTRNFGEGQYSLRKKAYQWSSHNVALYFKKEKKSRLQLIYHSKRMDRRRRDEIKKSYTDVSDDF